MRAKVVLFLVLAAWALVLAGCAEPGPPKDNSKVVEPPAPAKPGVPSRQ